MPDNVIRTQFNLIDEETARLASIIWRSRVTFETGYAPRQGLWDARFLEWCRVADPNGRDANIGWAISLAVTLQASI